MLVKLIILFVCLYSYEYDLVVANDLITFRSLLTYSDIWLT